MDSYRYPNPAAPITMTERFPREVKFNELDDMFKFSYEVLTNLAFPGVDVPHYFASEDDGWLCYELSSKVASISRSQRQPALDPVVLYF
ncbi:unnamed protein product [Heligmosomoides polygyrus]|uniref:Acetyltransferase n=1 Tax=Heligmosomoides polygyrus TaxID=6339 RepID=A0A183GU22_HELPZ|nr:unnamed protein product [Heligmosomoides polygyrus]